LLIQKDIVVNIKR